MTYIIFASFFVIGNLINIWLKNNKTINVLIGFAVIWPIFFSISSFYTHNFAVVSTVYLLLLIAGFIYMIKSKSFIRVFLISLGAGIILFLLGLIVQFHGDLDSKNYLVAMTRINFDSWGLVCDKVIGIVGMADHHYYNRLSYIGYGWVHNIFLVPLEPQTAYVQSLFFYILGLIILVRVIASFIRKHLSVVESFSLFVMAVGIVGSYVFYSANWGQMNQSFSFLLSVVTIYLFFVENQNKTLLVLLSSVISILILFSYTEYYFIWLMLYFCLLGTNVGSFAPKIRVALVLAPLSILPVLLPNFNVYYNFFFGQVNVNLVVNLIESPIPRYGLIYYFFQFFQPSDYLGAISNNIPEVRNILVNIMPILFFWIMYSFANKLPVNNRRKYYNQFLIFGIVVYLSLYLYILTRNLVINYQVFKYSGWTSWIVLLFLFIFLVSLNLKKQIPKLLLGLFFILVASRVFNMIGLYSRVRSNTAPEVVNPQSLDVKNIEGKCIVYFNKDYIQTSVTLGKYLVEKNDCVCEREL